MNRCFRLRGRGTKSVDMKILKRKKNERKEGGILLADRGESVSDVSSSVGMS